MNIPNLIPNLIDKEPVVAMGCTAREVKYGLIVTLLVSLASMLFLGIITNAWMASLVIGSVMGFVLFLGMLKAFAYANRTREPGYYIQKLQMYLEKSGVTSAPFVHSNNRFKTKRET